VGGRRLVGLPPQVTATRRHIAWSLDLHEGIDLAIYLLGGFEVRTLDQYASIVREGDVVLDIGANIGAHTLPFAQLVGDKGRVIAFEPTDYAFRKLQTNISLNPALAARIDARQTMLVADDDAALPSAIYSSWPLERADDLHDQHLGRLKETRGARAETLDHVVAESHLQRLDFIKLDVDGNEIDVLQGGIATLQRFKPNMMLELMPHGYAPGRFEILLKLVWDLGYTISDVASGKAFPADPVIVRNSIPEAGGINVMATARPAASP
jgi:FkbM family methyltransferase